MPTSDTTQQNAGHQRRRALKRRKFNDLTSTLNSSTLTRPRHKRKILFVKRGETVRRVFTNKRKSKPGPPERKLPVLAATNYCPTILSAIPKLHNSISLLPPHLVHQSSPCETTTLNLRSQQIPLPEQNQDDLSSSDEWKPPSFKRSLTSKRKVRLTSKQSIKVLPKRATKKRTVKVRKKPSPRSRSGSAKFQIKPTQYNPTFPKHSPLNTDLLSNGVVVWAKAYNKPWLPGRVEWVRWEFLDLKHSPSMHDPGVAKAPEVPIRFFDVEKVLEKVPRCKIIQFNTEDAYLKQRTLWTMELSDLDMMLYKNSTEEAIHAVRWVNKDWLKKPLLVKWGSLYCIGQVVAVDLQSGFSHIVYKTGFQEKIFIGSREFYFLADPSFLFLGVKKDVLPSNRQKYVDSLFERWPPIHNDPSNALPILMKQVPQSIHKMFCASERLIVLDPNAQYFGAISTEPFGHVFRMRTGTSNKGPIAETCFNLCESQWNRKIVRVKQAESLYQRQNRPLTGCTYLESPTGEPLVATIWSMWKLNAWEHGVMIKFFITKTRNRVNVSQRRKGNGSIVVAYLLDLAFSRYDVNLVVTCSERGSAQKFWASRGFKEPSREALRNISRVPIHELNPFTDTVLLAITRMEFCEKYLCNDPSAVSAVFRRWCKKHKKRTRNITFKHEKRIIRELIDLPKY